MLNPCFTEQNAIIELSARCFKKANSVVKKLNANYVSPYSFSRLTHRLLNYITCPTYLSNNAIMTSLTGHNVMETYFICMCSTW